MTQIIFDIKRDNGYGSEVYLPGSILWTPSNKAVSPNPPMSISAPLGGPISIDVQPTDDTFWWEVNEKTVTSGGSERIYRRYVIVPVSEKPINFLDLPDVDFNIPYPGQNSPSTVEESLVVEEAPAVTE